MEKHHVYSISLPHRLAHRARVIAAIEGKSRSQLIREMLEDLVSNFELQVDLIYMDREFVEGAETDEH